MSYPKIVVNTYTDTVTNHTNVTFYGPQGNNLGTWGANLGISAIPGSTGGVYEETNPGRIPSFISEIHFTGQGGLDAFNAALNYAIGAAYSTANGAGVYMFVGANCYDFVDNVLQAAGFPNNSAWEYMEPGSKVHSYGFMQDFVTDMFWPTNYQRMIDDPSYTPMSNFEIINARYFIETVGSEDEIVITARLDDIEYNTWVSPLAIDLGGNGFQPINLAQSEVVFDFSGNDEPIRTAWIGPEDGFLVRDIDDDGHISDLSEMFGGRQVGDAFEKLATLDDNRDGKIDNLDAAFSFLQVWIDANSNGASEHGELFALEDLNITELSLDAEIVDESLGDVFVAERSSAVVNGTSVEFSDLFFRSGGLAINYESPDLVFQLANPDFHVV